MRSYTMLILFLAATTALADGQCQVVNNCPWDVYLMSIGGNNGDSAPLRTITPMDTYTENFWTPDSGGVSVKIGNDGALESNILQFEYTVAGNDLWYDLSNINTEGGNPFQGQEVQLSPGTNGCDIVTCPANSPTCMQAFNKPNDTQDVHHCTTDSHMVLTLCAASQPTRKREVQAVRHSHAWAHGRRSRV